MQIPYHCLLFTALFLKYYNNFKRVVSSSKCNIGFNRMKYRFPISLEIKRVFRQEEFSWALPAQ